MQVTFHERGLPRDLGTPGLPRRIAATAPTRGSRASIVFVRDSRRGTRIARGVRLIEYDSTPFGQGPVRHLDRLLTLRPARRASVFRCAAVAFLLSWPPLVGMAAWQGLALGGQPHEALLLDFLASARY